MLVCCAAAAAKRISGWFAAASASVAAKQQLVRSGAGIQQSAGHFPYLTAAVFDAEPQSKQLVLAHFLHVTTWNTTYMAQCSYQGKACICCARHVAAMRLLAFVPQCAVLDLLLAWGTMSHSVEHKLMIRFAMAVHDMAWPAAVSVLCLSI
jgi:hypothetical protein